MGRDQTFQSPAIEQFRPHHRSMARAMVAAGMTPMELSLAFGFTPGHISRIVQSPLFQAELARLEAQADEGAVDMKKTINGMSVRALEVLDEDLEFEPTTLQARALRQKAAMDVLDRAGYRKNDRPIGVLNLQQTQINVNQMTTEDLRDEVMDLIGEEQEGGDG